jgi:hypothetical protein
MDSPGVDGGACTPLQSELIDEIREDGEVTTGLRSGPGLTLGQKAEHCAAVLRRTGSIPVQANGIAFMRGSLMPAPKAHLVLPGNIEVVLVAEAGT